MFSSNSEALLQNLLVIDSINEQMTKWALPHKPSFSMSYNECFIIFNIVMQSACYKLCCYQWYSSLNLEIKCCLPVENIWYMFAALSGND